jgi:hypothetical protein
MYFKVVKKVLDECIVTYCDCQNIDQKIVDGFIRDHIDRTAIGHRNPNPNIAYQDPLCRLGYLFKHAGANACLFERTVEKSDALKAVIGSSDKTTLSICTVGGGPGTELLGLTKYLIRHQISPEQVKFTVLDKTHHWGETWDHLADCCEDALRSGLPTWPSINKSFHPMDVMSQDSYRPCAFMFRRTNVFVFNYLLSENQVRLSDFGHCLDEMIVRSPGDALFVFIDRLERQTEFRTQVRETISLSGLAILSDFELGGCMDDPEADLGSYPTRFGFRPRRWFRTHAGRHPTVFAVVAEKGRRH